MIKCNDVRKTTTITTTTTTTTKSTPNSNKHVMWSFCIHRCNTAVSMQYHYAVVPISNNA